MGNSAEDTTTKTPKSSSTQEQLSQNGAPTVFTDWTSFQAYYSSAGTTPIATPAFFPPMTSSPQGHPYVWGPQIMPPYGTPPPPYIAMFPPGAFYPHPAVPLGSYPYGPYAMTSSTRTNDASVGAGGGIGIDGKNNETRKASGASANSVSSQSEESGSEASSAGSDASSHNAMQAKQCHGKNLTCGESKNVDAAASESDGASRATQSPTVSNYISPIMAIPPGAITAPSTSLNIGMDYWGGPSSASVSPYRSKLPITPCPAAVSAHDTVPSDLSLQDERELKRQKRKQSNRESARRSRLRKQVECEEVTHRVGSLKEENVGLRAELARIREDCEKLASENTSLTERLEKHQGKESRANGDHHHPESDSG